MKRLLGAFILLFTGGFAYAGQGASSSLTVSSGTFTAIQTFTNNSGNRVQGIAVADSSYTWTAPVDAVQGLTVTVSSGIAEIGNVKNSGTFATQAAQSGTWNITNISGTVSLPTGASTAAKQPALGTAGSASADVISVQGIASMTALKVDGSAVTQPISGTVTTNQFASYTVTPGTGTFSTTGSTVTIINPAGGTLAVSGTVAATQSGTWTNTVTQATPASLQSSVSINGSSNTVVLGAGAATIGALTANQSVNVAQFNGVTPLMNNGVSGTGSQRVNVASDNTVFTVNTSSSIGSSTPGSYIVCTSTIANVAASQTDQILVGGVASTVFRIVAVSAVAGATATNLTFNDKGAGAGTAISPLYANGANGGAILPRNDLGWFLTQTSGNSISVTTGAGSTTGISLTYCRY